MGALVLGVSSVVYANVCAFDPVPAASLLFPFVAYDYSGNTGTTTLFAITNVSSEATIVHVTVWTDFSIPILDFNILLTGYDVQRMNIRDILASGTLPVTLYQGHTEFEGVADDGPVSSGSDLNGAWIESVLAEPESTNPALNGRCTSNTATFPGYPGQYTQAIPGGILALFQQWLQSSQTEDRFHSDDCNRVDGAFAGRYVLQGNPDPWFESRDDSTPTWMYITADVVETCNKRFPDEPAYWDFEARYENVLMGDMQWVDPVNRFSESSLAVHIEADIYLDDVATENPYIIGRPMSFYSRYSGLATTNDYREPLPTAWAFRYIGADRTDFHTYVRAWKGGTYHLSDDIVYDLEIGPDANESPDWFVATNCWAYTYYAWDDDENVIYSSSNPWSQPGGEYVIPNLLPLETQEVDIDQFNTVDDYGWMLFVWPPSNTDMIGGPFVGLYGTDPDVYQTWMGVKYTAFGQYSSFNEGLVMANWSCFSDQVLPNLGIDYGYIDPVAGIYNESPCTVDDLCF
jgi:hypothetical protein